MYHATDRNNTSDNTNDGQSYLVKHITKSKIDCFSTT